MAEGTTGATLAAWRLQPETVEYLVLGDASILLGSKDGSTTEITDNRITRATSPLIEEQLAQIEEQGLKQHDDASAVVATFISQGER